MVKYVLLCDNIEHVGNNFNYLCSVPTIKGIRTHKINLGMGWGKKKGNLLHCHCYRLER